jgi:Holliday junction resolvasome RuvABC endonuclease subunit
VAACPVSLAIGLDVSELRMGWAVVDYDTLEPLALGVENLRERDGGWAEDQVLRAMNSIGHEYDRSEVFVVGIEDAYLGPNKKASLRHASVVGMATMAARVVFGPSVTYWPIPADSWRHALGIKGKNRAEKKALTMEWAESHVDAGGTGLVLTEDEADALGIATACAMLTEKQEAA